MNKNRRKRPSRIPSDLKFVEMLVRGDTLLTSEIIQTTPVPEPQRDRHDDVQEVADEQPVG